VLEIRLRSPSVGNPPHDERSLAARLLAVVIIGVIRGLLVVGRILLVAAWCDHAVIAGALVIADGAAAWLALGLRLAHEPRGAFGGGRTRCRD
jgi:hypothetical protein